MRKPKKKAFVQVRKPFEKYVFRQTELRNFSKFYVYLSPIQEVLFRGVWKEFPLLLCLRQSLEQH